MFKARLNLETAHSPHIERCSFFEKLDPDSEHRNTAGLALKRPSFGSLFSIKKIESKLCSVNSPLVCRAQVFANKYKCI